MKEIVVFLVFIICLLGGCANNHQKLECKSTTEILFKNQFLVKVIDSLIGDNGYDSSYALSLMINGFGQSKMLYLNKTNRKISGEKPQVISFYKNFPVYVHLLNYGNLFSMSDTLQQDSSKSEYIIYCKPVRLIMAEDSIYYSSKN